jgi:hypothetical protein
VILIPRLFCHNSNTVLPVLQAAAQHSDDGHRRDTPA